MGEWLLSRRDRLIVARHEVPGTAAPQKSRPVGYGMIRAGVRTDSKIGGEEISNAVSLSRIERSQNALWDQLRPIIPYPTGRFFRGTLSHALRAWLRSACPSGTKAIRPWKGIPLSQRLWALAWVSDKKRVGPEGARESLTQLGRDTISRNLPIVPLEQADRRIPSAVPSRPAPGIFPNPG